METVIDKIRATLAQNGFPEKMVRLPFQPIFKACKSHGTTLSAVLNELKLIDILSEIDADRILFFHRSQSPRRTEKAEGASQRPAEGISEELYAEAMEKLKSMDPAELERIKARVMAMSDKERADLLNQAKRIFQNRNS